METTTPYHTAILLGIVGLFTGMGLLAARKTRAHTLNEFFFAAGSVHWILVGTSMLGSMVWALVVLVLATPAGIRADDLWIPAFVLAVFLALLGSGVASSRKTGSRSLVAHITVRFGRSVGLLVAAVWTGFGVFVRIPLTILVGSRLLAASLGWDLLQASLLLVALPGLLVVTRGYVVVLIGYTAAVVLAVATVIGLAMVGSPPAFLAIIRNPSPEVLPTTAVIAGALVLGVWYSFADELSLHHIICARDRRSVRMGSLAAAFALVVLGLVGATVIPGAIEYPASASNGLMSVLIGSTTLFLSVAMLSSHSVAVANLAGCDLYQTARPDNDEGSVLLVSRAVTAVVVIGAILAGVTLGLMGIERVDWFLRALAAIAPPLAAIVVMGEFWERAHGRGALWALAIGWGSGIVWSLFLAADVAAVCFGTVATFAVTAVLLAVVSLAATPSPVLHQVSGAVHRSALRSDRPQA